MEITELCPECEIEVLLKDEFRIQECPNCGKRILPCSICHSLFNDPLKCSNCPLEEYN